VGTLAMMQGGSAISKDLPPYTMARGDNGISGLNIIGLRRAGLTSEQRLELDQLYHFLFREGRTLSDSIEAGRKQFSSEQSRTMLDFLAGAKRGTCADRGRKRVALKDD
jgi:UDP-N-acetylglucosamine acyltransferase